MANLDNAVKHLREAIAFRTVSNTDETKTDWDEFYRFHAWLRSAYPRTHNALQCETVSKASLLYKWQGKNGKQRPFALLAHMDVVPIEEATLKDWKHPPFDGFADETSIWGRGASDMKNQLVALFEAIETLLSENYTPERDIYLCLGHNEEVQVGEASGAREMARLLQERGVQFEFVLDEGGAVTDTPFFGLKRPAAMIGLAEKGYAEIHIAVSGEGGHAAEPPDHTALGNLALAISAVEANPLKQRLVEPVSLTLEALGRHMGFFMRFIIANKRFFKPLILAVLAKDKQTNAMTRTTIAATMAEASPAANVLPQQASALFNVRILPGETAQTAANHIRRVAAKALANRASATVEIVKSAEPVEMRATGRAYGCILRFLPEILPDIVPVPYLVTGATDSHEYMRIADEIYRFYPFFISEEELNAMHATNERIRRESLAGALRFNYHFIRESGGK